ncbi:MAG TPA: hypothetical protein VHH88_06785 [Verrucomicrobiae bacterium]|nr:hypothetical protein [Verrucomicrobiae bacterium]
MIGLITTAVCGTACGQANSSGTFSTPAYGDNRAATPNSRVNSAGSAGVDLGQAPTTGLGQAPATVGQTPTLQGQQPSSTPVSPVPGTVVGSSGTTTAGTSGRTAITPTQPALSRQGTTVIGQPPSTAIGQQGNTAIGQQGNTALGQQGSTAIGQQGAGTALIPQTNGITAGPNGFNTGVSTPSERGGSLGIGLGGTNTGVGAGTQNMTNGLHNP